MKKKWIVTVSGLVVASVAFTGFSIFKNWDIKIINFLIAIVPILLFYVQFLVENQTNAFIWWNKVKVRFKNPGLKWQLTSYLDYSDIDMDKMNEFYDNVLQVENYNYYGGNTPQMILKRNNTLIIEIGITQYTLSVLSDSSLKITSSSNVNYKDSKEQLGQDFEYLQKIVNRTLEKNPNSEEYSLKITFKNENPYYGLLLKSVEEGSISSFILKYSTDNLKLTVSKNTIEARTNSFIGLSKFSENYLVLSES